MCGGRVATKTCIKSPFVLRTAAAKKTCTTAFQTPTNMHIHHHTSHAASASGALDDAADGARAAPVARAPAAELPIARAVQLLELEVPARGRGAREGRAAAAAARRQQLRVSAGRSHLRRRRRRRRGRRPARAHGSRRG